MCDKVVFVWMRCCLVLCDSSLLYVFCTLDFVWNAIKFLSMAKYDSLLKTTFSSAKCICIINRWLLNDKLLIVVYKIKWCDLTTYSS